MSIDNDTVKKIAYLSKLKVEDDKLEETQQEFNKILAWVNELNELDTTGVEPLVSVYNEEHRLRKDDVTAGNICKEVLKNAPAQEFGYFVVPKVVE